MTWTDEDTERRPAGCACQWEAGDSPCPVHGEDDGATGGGPGDWTDGDTEMLRTACHGCRGASVMRVVVSGDPCAGDELVEDVPCIVCVGDDAVPGDGDIHGRAADEIERLRARVAELERESYVIRNDQAIGERAQREHERRAGLDSRLGDALRASGINAADALAVQALYATAGQSGSHRIVSALRAVEAWIREGGAA